MVPPGEQLVLNLEERVVSRLQVTNVLVVT